MSEKSQAEFLFAVIKHSPKKVNIRHLSAALNLTVGATNMRMTRLKRKMLANDCKVKAGDLEFLESVFEINEGKTDIKKLAAELGINAGAVSMRLTRLRARIAERKGLGRAKAPKRGEDAGLPDIRETACVTVEYAGADATKPEFAE